MRSFAKLADASKMNLKFFVFACIIMNIKAMHWEFQCNYASFENILETLLNCYQANVFDPEHLKGASSDLVRSMFQVGWKAAELERVKLQTEIQKKKSEIR